MSAPGRRSLGAVLLKPHFLWPFRLFLACGGRITKCRRGGVCFDELWKMYTPCSCPRSQDGDVYVTWRPFPSSASLDSWFRTPQVRRDFSRASGEGTGVVCVRALAQPWLGRVVVCISTLPYLPLASRVLCCGLSVRHLPKASELSPVWSCVHRAAERSSPSGRPSRPQGTRAPRRHQLGVSAFCPLLVLMGV